MDLVILSSISNPGVLHKHFVKLSSNFLRIVLSLLAGKLINSIVNIPYVMFLHKLHAWCGILEKLR